MSLSSTFSAWERAAQAFMTTNTFFRLAGMDKGAGTNDDPSFYAVRQDRGGLHALLPPQQG
ncbi:hypothetical protein M378DRAFT_161679 [Amanita muscaria Koide BX008]|uniref:Uncharacterized protein n=1 Tax=Amanita muscaria (strain Koide BX008) TaxID=946122 RepID=A0A0C2SQY4_AMAMK|nr:hypothetical protein M378DRAFT_161679 [Amanita muscaria Koide BX008]